MRYQHLKGTTPVLVIPNLHAHTAIIPCQKPHPSKQASQFARGVMLSLSNPLTGLPKFQQSKAELYHGQVGQVPREKWEAFRDEYIEKALKEWKEFILEWR